MCKKFGFALGVRRGNISLVSRAIQNHYEKKSLKEIEKVGLKAFKGHFVWILFRCCIRSHVFNPIKTTTRLNLIISEFKSTAQLHHSDNFVFCPSKGKTSVNHFFPNKN